MSTIMMGFVGDLLINRDNPGERCRRSCKSREFCSEIWKARTRTTPIHRQACPQ